MNKFLPLFLIFWAIAMSAKALPTNVSGHITANTTWNIAGSPYTITGAVTVDQGKTLTIKPGVTVQFPNAGGSTSTIYVDGTLKAIGTVDSVINFTSTGGYAYGQVKTIAISTLSTNSIMQYVTADGLGQYFSSDYTAAIILNSPTCQLKNSNIINAIGTAVELDDANIVSNNNIAGYRNLAIIVLLDNINKLSSNNAGLYIGLLGGAGITKNATLTPGNYYRLLGQLIVPQSKVLTIKPGVTIQFPNAGGDNSTMYVDGTLKAVGTIDSAINFTSTGGYAYGQVKTVTVSSLSANSIIQYVTADGLGQYFSSDYTAAFILNSSTCQLKNSNIINAVGTAVELDNASIVSNNNFNGYRNLAVIILLDNLNKLSNNNTGLYIGLLGGTGITKNATIAPGNIYRLLGQLIIPQSKILTIKPGATIQLPNAGGNSSSIYVDGILKAIGTVDSAVNITGVGGYAYGQDKTITISNLSANSIMQYVTADGLGQYFNSDYTAGIILQSPTFQLKNCNIINTKGTAIELDDASIVSNNNLTGYSNLGVYISIDNLGKLSNNTTGIGIGLAGGSIARNAILTPGNYYRLLGKLVVPQSKILTVKPGVTLQFPNSGGDNSTIYVDGTLKAIGTIDSAINFAGIGGYAYGQVKTVTISSISTNSIIQYITADGLGQYFNSDYTAAFILNSSTCQLKNSSVINTKGTAVELDNANIVSNNSFTAYSNLAVIILLDNLNKLSNNNTGLYIGLLGGAGITKNATLISDYYYRLLGQLIVPQNKILTVKPGVTIQLPNTGGDNSTIYVDGTLKAVGTVDSAINITGIGGFAYGQVRTITISSLSTNSVMQYVTADALGQYFNSINTPGIYVNTTNCSIKNCNIINSKGVGISLLANTSTLISNNSFSNNTNGDILADATSVSNLSGNSNASVYLPAAAIQQDATWSNPGNTSKYILNGAVTVNESYKLTIAAGTTIDFQNNNGNLFIKGTLTAIGTKSNKILFTKTGNGYGGSVSFDSVSKGSLIYVVTNRLGTATSPGKGAALELNSKYPITIRNDSIRNSESNGLAIRKGSPVIVATNFTNNKNGVYSYTGKALFTKSSFTGNGSYGINNASPAPADTIDARNCWWDDPSGPYQSQTNPTGLGDSVTLKVLYKPFAKKPFEPNDVGVISILSPVSACSLSGAEQVKVQIKNFGIEEQTGFNVSYRINTGAVITENVGSLKIATDSTADYTFATLANLSQPGKSYTLKAYTALVGDTVVTNDSSTIVTSNRKPNLGNDTAVKICKESVVNLWTLYDTTGYKTKNWSAPKPDSAKAGTYTLIVTSSAGCADTAVASVTNYSLATPTVSASGNTTFCKGASVTLTSSPAPDYLWSTGAITQNIVAKTSGNYTVTTSNDTGCHATSAPTLVQVDSTAKPTVTPAGPVNLCPNSSVTLTASVEDTYAWSTNAVTQSITVSAPGSYTVTVKGLNGCKNTSDPVVVTQTCDKPANLQASSLSATSEKLSWSTIACGVGYSVQYRKTGTTTWTPVSAAAANVTLTGLTANTNYDWEVATTCQASPLIQSPFTSIATFTTAASLVNKGIPDAASNTGTGTFLAATVYPVPVTNNAATLVIKNSNGNAAVTLKDVSGKILWSVSNVADGKMVLPVGKIAPGTYIINVYSGKEFVTVKLIKQ